MTKLFLAHVRHYIGERARSHQEPTAVATRLFIWIECIQWSKTRQYSSHFHVTPLNFWESKWDSYVLYGNRMAKNTASAGALKSQRLYSNWKTVSVWLSFALGAWLFSHFHSLEWLQCYSQCSHPRLMYNFPTQCHIYIIYRISLHNSDGDSIRFRSV